MKRKKMHVRDTNINNNMLMQCLCIYVCLWKTVARKAARCDKSFNVSPLDDKRKKYLKYLNDFVLLLLLPFLLLLLLLALTKLPFIRWKMKCNKSLGRKDWSIKPITKRIFHYRLLFTFKSESLSRKVHSSMLLLLLLLMLE